MKKAFVSLITILALAMSAFASDHRPRHVAETGSAFELALPAFAGVLVTDTAPSAWLSASNLRMSRSEQMVSVGTTASQRGLDREIYLTKNDYAIGNRPRAVTHGRRLWRV